MTQSHQFDEPAWSVGRRTDLDEIFKDAAPVGTGEGWLCEPLFESDEEQQDFVAWYRSERRKDIA